MFEPNYLSTQKMHLVLQIFFFNTFNFWNVSNRCHHICFVFVVLLQRSYSSSLLRLSTARLVSKRAVFSHGCRNRRYIGIWFATTVRSTPGDKAYPGGGAEWAKAPQTFHGNYKFLFKNRDIGWYFGRSQ